MKIGGRHCRTIFPAEDGEGVAIIDQTKLPFALALTRLTTLEEAAAAIREMQVRGASLIGATDHGAALTAYTHLTGETEAGEIVSVRVAAPGSPAANPAFDVTPARLITGLITERGICAASREGLAGLYPDYTAAAAQ